jgi:extracellular elastinolytic metalloproteinase
VRSVAVLVGMVVLLGVGAATASAVRPAPEPLQARAGGLLTPPSEQPPATVALDYVRTHPGKFGLDAGDLAGLRLVRAYRFAGEAAHLQWEQRYRGIPVFGPGLRANVDSHGRLINVGHGALPDPEVASVEPRLSALDALLAAGRAAGATVVPGRPSAPAGPERATRFADGQRASLTLFGGDRLAWRVLLRGHARHVYDAVVDATSGATLYRVSLVRAATGLAFDNYPGAPIGGTQTAKLFPQGGIDPWLTEPSPARLFGTNAHVFSDPDDDIDGFPPDPGPALADEIAPSAAGAWSYAQDARPPTSPGLGQHCPAPPGCSWDNFDLTAPNFSWRVNRAQAGTQLFYFVNHYHDHLRDAAGIGFDDSSGNFEGADRVQAQVDDGATTDSAMFDDFPDCNHINNAFVIPVPDGTPLVMQIYLWSNACTEQGTLHDVNAADDALVVYHEYTHGLTNRLVTDAAGFPGLNGPQPGAMDEGFADWYALDILNAEGFQPDTAAPGELVAGRYENDQLRTQAFDCPVGAPVSACPGSGSAGSGGYTYGDFGKILPGPVPAPEVHADGEIWVETLWDLRRRLIADHGAGEGIGRARALVTDGLRLAPANPTFLDMRNAILAADLNRGFGDRDRIWAVFAARGMGVQASTSGNFDTAPVEDFSVPPAALGARDTRAPSISRVGMTRRRFKVGRGTTFTFRLSEAATVRIAIARVRAGRRVGRRCRPARRGLRQRPRCTRYVRKGTLVRANLGRGARRVHFSGRLRSRALDAGLYRASISATDAAGNRSRAVRVTFRIVRR